MTRVVTDPATLGPAELETWDALAAATGQPYAAPGWALPWARHVGGGEPLVVLAGEAGVGPFLVRRPVPGARVAVLLSDRTAGGLGLLARPGAEAEVAAACVTALRGAGVGAVVLRGLAPGPDWPALLAAAWPGAGASVHELEPPVPAPALALAGLDWEGWLATKRGKSRKRLLRGLDRLAAEGVTARCSEGDRLAADLATFARLHHARWADRGGSAALTPAVEAMLAGVARELPAPERLRLWLLEREGEAIAAELLVVAGGHVASWLGGFDDAHAELQPSVSTLLLALRDAFGRGEAHLDLGPGDATFKQKLAGTTAQQRSVAVLARDRRSVPARALVLAERRARRTWHEHADGLPPAVRALRRRLSARG